MPLHPQLFSHLAQKPFLWSFSEAKEPPGKRPPPFREATAPLHEKDLSAIDADRFYYHAMHGRVNRFPHEAGGVCM